MNLRLAEKIFIILGLSFFAGIFGVNSLGFILPKIIVTLIRYFVWGMSSVLICVFWKSAIVIASKNKLLCILTGLALLSFTWSQSPDYTLLNATEVLMMTSFALYFATRFSLKEQVQLIAYTMFIGSILSTIIALGYPALGTHTANELENHLGAWKGVYGHKNSLGSMMVLSSLVFFVLPKENSISLKWLGFSFSIFLMLLSTSKSSLVISCILILIMLFYKKFRWKGRISVIFVNIGILILACLAIVVLTYWVELLTGLGRDPTLTGRTYIWDTALAGLLERPFFGFGRGAFWAPESKYIIQAGYALRSSSWLPSHGHNGFLDLTLDLGLIGLSIFCIIYFTTFAQSLKQAYATNNLEKLWPIGYLTYLAMSNVTESNLLRLANLYWVLFITVVFTVNYRIKTKKVR
ncbi:O-antigen polymerase [Calothrix sp. NIES-4071]|nr:O-antigen polymerase [Calothrix sp. NIES-4071]BAZ55833.1 O-antigen polymerase [Calothrix sp. NIES-4105]